MGSVSRVVDRAIPESDTARLAKWERSETRRKRAIYYRKLLCLIETLVWPLTPRIFALLGTAVASLCFAYLHLLPETAIYVSWMLLCSLLLVMKLFIACLLRYRGWLNHRLTWHTKLWGMLMTLAIPASATPHCFDHLLPPLPYPNPLKVTVGKFVNSMEPVLTAEEHEDLKKKGQEFINGIGWKLHLMLLIRAALKWNWFSDWWQRYAYLANRKPLFTSSVAGADTYRVEYNRMDRMAVWTYGVWKAAVEGRHDGGLEQMKLNGLIPLCMSSTKFFAGTTRIPKPSIDQVEWFDPLRTGYIMVKCLGHYYKVHMYDDRGCMLRPGTLKLLFEQIWLESSVRGPALFDPAIFTTLPREEWYHVRNKLIDLSPSARALIKAVEESAFMVNFEDEYSCTNKEDYYLYGTHGYGHVWYDKSMTFVSFKNAEILCFFEHTSLDGLVMTAGKDYTTIEEFYSAQINEPVWLEKKGLISDERAFNAGSFREPQGVACLSPADVTALAEDFHRARRHLTETAMDIRVGHMLCEKVDRKVAKRVKISPDAMIQCGIQLAYHRIHRQFVLSYQPATLQHYAYGRTENIRPLTMHKVNFVKAMDDPCKTADEKFALLKLASNEHSDITKAAMAMKGVDRHLFALYVILKGQGLHSDFLEFAMNRGSTMPLCTSCLPNKTLDRVKRVSRCDQDWMKCPSAGVFRNQDKEGYGIFYMEADPSRTKFVVTSSASCETTDPIQFCQTLKQSLADITQILESQLDPTQQANPPLKPQGAT